MTIIVSWQWDFDDGYFSKEKNPDHIYEMAGLYEATLVRTDINGNEYTSRFRIRVYDYDYTGKNPNASITDKCYRLPVRAGDGYGPSEFKDSDTPGFDWVWPAARKGSAVGYDENQKEVALILDTKTQKWYRINRPDIWQDRLGGDYAEGKRIISEIHQKSYEANQGGYLAIVHNETHSQFEAYKKDFKGADGYDSEGYPQNMRVDMDMHKDNEEVLSKRTVNVPKDGDIVFMEKLEARQLQLRTKIYHAPWLITELQNNFDTIDKASRPSLRQMTETAYQENLSSFPLFHVSRSFFPLINRATGENATGNYSGIITGPDGKEYSALSFPSGEGLSDTLVSDLNGDFTLSAWFKDTWQQPYRLWEVGDLYITINDDKLHIEDGVNIPISVSLDYTGTGWILISVIRLSNTISVYENGELKGLF